MIRGKLWELHDDETLRKIDAAAVRLLTESGVRIHHEGLLEMMEAAGCRVDPTAMRCYFPEGLIRQAIEHFRTNPPADVGIPSGWNPQRHLYHGGSYPHLLDWPSGRRRLARKQDVIDMAKMAHTLDEFEAVGRVLTCCEADHKIEPLWTTLTLAETSNKPIGGGEIFEANYIEPLVRMGEVLSGKSGDAHLVAACDFFISPLIFDRKQAEVFLEKRRFGLPVMPGTMAISGMSAPVTLAGTATVAVAELLAGWSFGYAVSPELAAGGIVSTGSIDMRTMAACFGSPEAIVQDAAVVQLCRRLHGMTVHAATGYVDCKRPGIEAAFQKMLPMAAVPLGIGRYPGADGLLSAGQDYSPVQHMLDIEIAKAVERFWGHFEVDEETLPVELIEQVIASGKTDFLTTDHTLKRYRTEQWYPKWFDRTRWQGREYETQAEHRMLERIDAYCQDAIRRYRRPEIDKSKLAEVRRIYRMAERSILGGG
jgi:trimethylamine--corrinoid protein Co-methyltransferase